MAGLTFDTGALIGLERRDVRIAKVFAYARETRTRITVPTVVVAEWWRASSPWATLILPSLSLESLDARMARLAGEAIAATPGATVVDAIVMASAATRGDVVYTSDVGDLERLRRHFPSVRVLGV
jgi:predicted nucleic acid-binding protein